MFPEVDRAFDGALSLAFVGLGVGGTLAAFWVADRLVERAVRLRDRLRFLLAPRCVDCGGRGWRRRKDGDGAPLTGWVDCRLCRGLGRIVED